MKMPIFLLLCLSLLLSLTAKVYAAENITAEEAKQLLNLTQVHKSEGAFVQEKYFKVLNKPFVSSGRFQWNQDSFIWRTQKPVPNAIIFSENQLWLEDHQGEKKQYSEATDIADMLRYFVSGDFAGLSKSFQFMTSDKANCVEMHPVSDMIKQGVESVLVCGQGYVSNITLIDPGKNRTEINIVPQVAESGAELEK